jgi:sodium pump decarboxylase gamma subunit
MADLMEGLNLMLLGMGVVFLFLIILVIMMKLIPILSKKKEKGVVQEIPVSRPPPMAHKVSPDQVKDYDRSRERARTVAAITAAITATVGKRPEKIIVTTPTGETTRVYSSWSYAGRQDLMDVGDLQGQRSFEW